MCFRLALILLIALFSSAVSAACPGGSMSTGWCWPTSNHTFMLGWHGFNAGFPGMVHLAQDIRSNEGDSVYAIASGVVQQASTDRTFYGGATGLDCNNNPQSIPGGGIIIRHTASNGQSFDVLYAHLKNLSVSVGDQVGPGQKIAEIRNYTWCGSVINHLHFGVEYPLGTQSNVWAGYASADIGFVNPLAFLQSVLPSVCGSSNGTCEMKKAGNVAWFPAVSDCARASQWFFVSRESNGEYVTIGSATAASCPQFCAP